MREQPHTRLAFEIKPGDAFVVLDDRDLEFLVRYSIEKQMVLDADMGIVSYNEALLNGIVAFGIKTISTDFVQMGKSMADMILNHQKMKIDNPFLLNKRSSLLKQLYHETNSYLSACMDYVPCILCNRWRTDSE